MSFLKRLFKKKSNLNFTSSDSDELNEVYLFDFTKAYIGKMDDHEKTTNNVENSYISFGSAGTSGTVATTSASSLIFNEQDLVRVVQDSPEVREKAKKEGKIVVKPIDVVGELETIPTPFNLIGLKEKIMVLNDKKDLLTQRYAKRDISALVERLQNRFVYPKHAKFFNGFQNTDDEKIEKLLAKYELVKKEADLFIPEFPDQAVKIMKDYTKTVMKICKKKPIFYVIAPSSMFRDIYKKRDPILLVQSPFGFYWQILGAWDKEMILLSEL